MKAKEIAATLGYSHIMHDKISVIRSRGSKTRRTIARIHGLGKVMMLGMGMKKSFYVIELISEKFDPRSEEEQIETIIHELMHIPHTFGGGFRNHKLYVTGHQVRKEFERYKSILAGNSGQRSLF